MPMRPILALAPTVVALVIAAVAGAGTSTYVGPQYWPPGNGGSSSYSNWFYNFFSKSAGGYDKLFDVVNFLVAKEAAAVGKKS